MKCLFFSLILLFLASCHKVDPSPETKDEIYQDLVTELDIATKTIESEEKALENAKKELEKSVPQTGQIKYASKKVLGAEEALSKTTQQKIYFDIKKERRKAYVQFRYQESLKEGGRPWPDEKEIEEYKSLMKFNREKLAWEKTKGMKKSVPRGTKAQSSPAGGESAPEH